MARGFCKFCGQGYEIFDNKNLTQGDYDNIATDKCTCEGAMLAKKANDWVMDARNAVNRIIRPISRTIADRLNDMLDPVSSGTIDSVVLTFRVGDEQMKATLKLGKDIDKSLKLTRTSITTVSSTIMDDDADNWVPLTAPKKRQEEEKEDEEE